MPNLRDFLDGNIILNSLNFLIKENINWLRNINFSNVSFSFYLKADGMPMPCSVFELICGDNALSSARVIRDMIALSGFGNVRLLKCDFDINLYRFNYVNPVTEQKESLLLLSDTEKLNNEINFKAYLRIIV